MPTIQQQIPRLNACWIGIKSGFSTMAPKRLGLFLLPMQISASYTTRIPSSNGVLGTGDVICENVSVEMELGSKTLPKGTNSVLENHLAALSSMLNAVQMKKSFPLQCLGIRLGVLQGLRWPS